MCFWIKVHRTELYGIGDLLQNFTFDKEGDKIHEHLNKRYERFTAHKYKLFINTTHGVAILEFPKLKAGESFVITSYVGLGMTFLKLQKIYRF